MPKVSSLHMLFMVIILCFYCYPNTCTNVNASALLLANDNNSRLTSRFSQLKNAFTDIRPYFRYNLNEQMCFQIDYTCEIHCFNGIINSLEQDIRSSLESSINSCTLLKKLNLYKYEYPKGILPIGFLGSFTNKIVSISISNSAIYHIDDGAFGNGIFKSITLDYLQIKQLNKGFFDNISYHFNTLTIRQIRPMLKVIAYGFLDRVKYQIQSLTIQAGITSVNNLTSSDILLNRLAYVNLIHNNFGSNLQEDSFKQLSLVDQLDLSFSNIECLPNNIFKNLLDTLDYLNLSHNRIKRISKLIFGYHKLPENLQFSITDNPWKCDCTLHEEMHAIVANSQHPNLMCASPEVYQNWSVFDDRLCHTFTTSVTSFTPMSTSTETDITETTFSMQQSTTITAATTSMPEYQTTVVPITTAATTSKTIEPEYSTSTVIAMATTTTATTYTPTTLAPPRTDIVMLDCDANALNFISRIRIYIKWPAFNFFLSSNATEVQMIINNQDESMKDSYGLVWFCNTTKEYEIIGLQLDKYGLGCYKNISAQTLVNNLKPGVAYTFCLIGNQESTVSPFSCKSVYIGGNLDVFYNYWSRKKVRDTRITILVFGIIVSLFIGILMVFLLLKRKPTLLKGNKRILLPKGSTGSIVVLPKHKTAEQLVYKEANLVKWQQERTNKCLTRRNSAESNTSRTSSDSYMSANLYETIPSYLALEDVTLTASVVSDIYATIGKPKPTLILQTLRHSATNSKNYTFNAEPTKRDPLPDLPANDKEENSLPNLEHISDASIEYYELN